MSAFYNEVMTFNETNVTATCCKLDGTPISVVCGRGYSCAALCFSEEASLCPSDNCANCEDLEEKPQQNLPDIVQNRLKWVPVSKFKILPCRDMGKTPQGNYKRNPKV